MTGAPDMVLFPGAGLLLPEAATRNPAAVARAVFERYPKIFGTGDPSSQLAFREVLTGSRSADPDDDRRLPPTVGHAPRIWVRVARALVKGTRGKFDKRKLSARPRCADHTNGKPIGGAYYRLDNSRFRSARAPRLHARHAASDEAGGPNARRASPWRCRVNAHILNRNHPSQGERAGLAPGTEGSQKGTNALVSGFDRPPPTGGEFENGAALYRSRRTCRGAAARG